MSYGYGGDDRRGPGISINPRLIIAVLIALFGVVSYYFNTQKNPVTGENQRVAMNVDQEKQLGLQAAPEMAQEMGGEIDPRTDPRAAEVARVGRKLVDDTEVAKSPYADNFHYHLLNDRKTINAFALPGGQVFITLALYEKLADEAELAGVLGHETGHVIHRHAAVQMAKGKLGQLLSTAVIVGANDNQRQGAAIASQMAEKMMMLRYSRGDESQADEYGLRVMTQAGYDPHAMLDVMNILKEASKGGEPPEWLSTHPLPETRLVRIKQELDQDYSHLPSGTVSRGRPLPGGSD